MTKSPFALPLSIVILTVSSLLVTGQEQPRRVPPPGQPNPSPQQAETLNTNYKITFSGKSDEKSLGELSILTCSKSISISGPLSSSDTPTTFSVSGTLEEKDGLIIFNYSIEFRVSVATTNQPGQAQPPPPPGFSRPIQYQEHTSRGTLKMKPGKAYDLLKSGGNIYSIVVAPEIEK
jgi:hypothetical protein